MPKCSAKLQPWQVFRAAYKSLGMSGMMAIWGKSDNRIIYAYGQDPMTTQTRVRNPLEKLHETFFELNQIGRGNVAWCAIDFLSSALDDHEPAREIKDLQPTIEGELLKDHTAVGKLQALVEEQADPNDVKRALLEAIDELNRTYAKYLQDLGK